MPQDTGLEGFSCAGYLGAYPAAYGPGGYGMTFDTGDCGGCDYGFTLRVGPSPDTLAWYGGDCPVSTLEAYLGFYAYLPLITRESGGVWSPRYTGTSQDMYLAISATPGSLTVYQRMYYLSPEGPFTWTGYYTPDEL